MGRVSNWQSAWVSLALLWSLVASGIVGCREQQSHDAADPRPNVLIYLVDTLRADSLEPYGNSRVETPGVQRLAAEGVLFERVYANSSWTRPSIASILTGLAPDVHRIETRHDYAPPELRLLAEIFQEQGYTTGAIITNPNVGAYFGFDQGYEDFVELFRETGQTDVGKKDNRAPSDEVTRRAIEWMDRAERPFFLFVVTIDPHWPYTPPPRFDRYRGVSTLGEKSAKARTARNRVSRHDRYLGEVAFNDDSFGRLLDHMRERGTYDESLIVFTSDHGEAFGEHNSYSHGKTLFAEAIRVPLIIRRPSEWEAGRRVKTPVQLLDIFPTVLAATGLPVPTNREGRALLRNDDAAPREIYAKLNLDGYSGEMILQPPWKLISPDTPHKGVRKMKGGLFNIDDDPEELTDMRDLQPDRALALQRLLEERFASGKRAGGVAASKNTRIDPGELPSDVRSALEALGYLEAGEAEADGSQTNRAVTAP